MRKKVALMVCTQARGGMLSVVEAYERNRIFGDWRFQSLWTHQDGSALVRLKAGLLAYFRLLGLLVRARVSFMHVHAAMRGSFWRKSLFIRTARVFGVPSIIHLHGSEMETFYRSLSAASQKMVCRTLERAEAVVVLSESWRKFVREIAPQAHITIINNYVDVPTADLVPAARSAGAGVSVLFLGKLGQRKGVFDLLACWPAVSAAIPGARLIMGGNGEVAAAQALAVQLGIAGSVDFLGWVDGQRKLDLLKDADIFVLPSHNEGLPMSVLEAMSWSKAVITTRVGGIPELVTDGMDGILFDAGNQEQLTAALLRLGSDPAYRGVIGAAARERIASHFSDSAVLPRLENLYRTVTASTGA